MALGHRCISLEYFHCCNVCGHYSLSMPLRMLPLHYHLCSHFLKYLCNFASLHFQSKVRKKNFTSGMVNVCSSVWKKQSSTKETACLMEEYKHMKGCLVLLRNLASYLVIIIPTCNSDNYTNLPTYMFDSWPHKPKYLLEMTRHSTLA